MVPSVAPGCYVGWARASGLGGGGQYDDKRNAVSHTISAPPLPLLRGRAGVGAAAREGVRDRTSPNTQQIHIALGAFPHPPSLRSGTLPRKREREETYTDAVVTPPSTMMVWPVMKVEASEAR